MKKNIMYVDAALLQVVVDTLGLRTEEQKGFIKVHLGPKGRLVYIGRTKHVGRVDLSGFTMPVGTPRIRTPESGTFGAVAQQIDFREAEGTTVETLVATFRYVLETGMALPDAEPKPKKAPGTSTPAPKAEGWSNDPVARLARVIDAGVKPSERLIAEATAHDEAATLALLTAPEETEEGAAEAAAS